MAIVIVIFDKIYANIFLLVTAITLLRGGVIKLFHIKFNHGKSLEYGIEEMYSF